MIYGKLKDFRSEQAFISTCNRTLALRNKYNCGYTYICISDKTDYIQYIKYYQKQLDKSVRIHLTLSQLDNPQEVIHTQKYPIAIVFNECIISEPITPDISPTRYIRIRKLNRTKHDTILSIDWTKFPNLEVLDIYVNDIDLSNIQICKFLKKVRINLVKNTKTIDLTTLQPSIVITNITTVKMNDMHSCGKLIYGDNVNTCIYNSLMNHL